jgi:hypothetical protein
MGYRRGMTFDPRLAPPVPVSVPAISTVYRLAPSEYITAVRVLVSRSRFAVGVGILLTAMGLLSLATGMGLESPVSFVVTVVLQVFFGIALITGWHTVPFCWYSTRRRPDLFNADMTFEMDDSGLHMRTAMYDSRIAWPYVRRARDLGRFLFFDGGTGGNLFVPARALDQASMVTVRRTLAERGLLGG